MTTMPHVLIIGAGPAGLGAAYQLVHKKLASVSVIEHQESVGGNAASFQISGVWVDYGSHRLHPACDQEILRDLQMLLGSELMDRPRHGRIRLRDRWIHFPLKPFDMALRLPLDFSMGVAIDLVRKNLVDEQKTVASESFASVLETGLGRTICRQFYFPYAHKIWGLPPDEMSPAQAHRRVSANSFKKMLRKIFATAPGSKSPGSARFFYPRGGFGQISRRLYDAAKNTGANFHLTTHVKSIQMNGHVIDTVCSRAPNGPIVTHRPEYVWSTIPVPSLVQLLRPQAPGSVIEASNKIQYRAMILIYLVLRQARFSEYDAHYFPGADIPITRISEPKNYSDAQEPRSRTVLCAELPCFTTDPEWKMTDEELGKLVCNCLEAVAIPVRTPVELVITRRVHHAYPIYERGYEIYFDQMDKWLSQIKNLLTFGRQGLFVHDNTHHALYMAYAAVDCLDQQGQFDRGKWHGFYRKIFETHVVED